MKNLLCVVLVFVLVVGLNGQTATHVVISEVQVGGGSTTDEFVELFNPTGVKINVSGWRLTKKTSSGGVQNLLTEFPDVSISPYSFYLIAHINYDGSTTPDANYSTGNSLASNNTVVLYSDAGSTVVDIVGFGTVVEFEGAATTNPSNDESIERKSSLLSSGMNGPAKDSDNNLNDFSINSSPNPQNSDSSLPVELSSFTAQQNGNAVELKWITQSELNNSGYYVLRSENDESNYQKISSLISGAGSSSEKHSYSFVDERIEPNRTYYYQLQQIDMDGTIESFGPVKVSIQTQAGKVEIPEESKLVCNYPNPFNPGTTIYLTLEASEDVEVSVYDVMGRKINSLFLGELGAGEHEMTWSGIDQHGLQVPSGHYFARMQTASGKISAIKVLKLQ